MKREIGRIRIILVLLAFCFCGESHAQSGLSMYHTNKLFNASNLNPAFLSSEEKFTLSFFPVAGMTAEFNDREAIQKVYDLVFFDEVTDAMKDIFRNMVNNRLYYQHGEITWLNFGYHDDFGSLSFVVKDHMNLMIDFYGDQSKFLMNSVDLNAPLDVFQDFPAEAIHYREYSIGYSKEILPRKLTIGGRLKMLFGKSFLSSNISASLTENGGLYYVRSKGDLRISLPADRVTNSSGHLVRLDPFASQSIADYIMNTGNTGLAVDLGLKYELNDEIELSASMTNIGNISWKKYLHDLKFDDAYELDNTELATTVIDGVNYVSKITNEVSLDNDISNLFGLPDVADTTFSTAVPASYYLGMKYKLSPDFHLGIVDRLIKSGGLTFNSLALTANYRLNKHFTLISGYSVHGSSQFNIPLGFFFEWNGGQAYLNTENLVSLASSSYDGFNGFSFGASFYVFRPKMKYEQIDYLPFFKKKRKHYRTGKGLIFNAD